MKLSNANLASLPPQVAAPGHDRAALSPGIVHFGVGNFHRAHQATYLDSLFASGRDHDWAIVGAGVLPQDGAMRSALEAQDYLTTVVEQAPAASSARVTGSMIDFLPPRDAAAILAALVDPATRIVSMTITEGGYFIDPASGEFSPDDPQLQADAANPASPGTVFGLLVEALRRRRAAGHAPFTVMSCDNVPHNGVVTRNAVAGLADLYDPELADWIRGQVAFPNAMVDRITPATSDRERQMLARDFTIEDNWPVFCEDFVQWVLEDTFPAGRPALQEVGVQFVSDVTPYEHMKIRILNGGHAVVAYPAGLLGIEYADQAIAHPLIARYYDKIERDEIIPTVPPVPETDLAAYASQVAARIANPRLGDTVRRLCWDGSNRQPKFIVPTVADRLQAGEPVAGLAIESALWCRYCHGTTEAGDPIEANDDSWERLSEIARRARQEPSAWLRMEDIYGEVGRSPVFQRRFGAALTALWSDGVERVLQRYLDGHPL